MSCDKREIETPSVTRWGPLSCSLLLHCPVLMINRPLTTPEDDHSAWFWFLLALVLVSLALETFLALC